MIEVTNMTDIIGVVEVEFTLNELVNMKETLQKVFEAKLPIKTSYRLSKLLNKVNAEFETFEKMRFELFQRYGEEAENNQMIIKEENTAIFTQEMTDLLSQSVKIEMIKIDLDELDGRVELSPLDVARLDKIIAN
jgi:single-stranded DNA-specific DHH superfamily exonuclease